MEFCNWTQELNYYYINHFNRKNWATAGPKYLVHPGIRITGVCVTEGSLYCVFEHLTWLSAREDFTELISLL